MKHRVWHLRGGIHPPEKKSQSLSLPLRAISLPEQLIVPLQQHIGAPASPCVAVGEHVLKGQLIASSDKATSALVHAPSSGTIREIGLHPVIHPSPIEQLCIRIDCDGKDEWIDHSGTDNYGALDPQTLLSRIREAGIIGMGGAGFPSSVKLNTGHNQIETLIINGAECEPYITADDILMQERAVEIIEGIKVIGHILQPKEILIGIEDNKALAVAALERASAETSIDIVKIPTKYPSGGEKQLIKILTGKEVPTGGLPLQVGVIVHNIGTVYSIYKAIIQGKPCISRITTLTGEAMGQRGNVKALIGTPVRHLLKEGGVHENQLFRIVAGGPMMGFTLPSAELPISKTTNCLIAATRAEMPPPPPEQTCIRCGQCADICPVTLLPQQLYFFSKAQEFDKAEQHNIFDCIECGACSYVCPSHIPLVQYYRYAKGTIRQLRAKEEKAEASRLRFENRQVRLEQEAAEKEAKRKARAKAAAEKAAQKAAAEPSAQASHHTEDELTRLKTAAASTAKLAIEAKKALSQAEKKEENADKLEQLRRSVETFQADSDKAKEALKAARHKPSTNTPSNEIGESKEDKAILELRDKTASAQDTLKQAKKALLAAKTSHTSDLETIEIQVNQAKEAADTLKAQLREALASQKERGAQRDTPSGSSSDTVASSTVASDKVAAALARNERRKAQKALDRALEEKKPEHEIAALRKTVDDADCED
jgi:electron transport complex protein RnfC